MQNKTAQLWHAAKLFWMISDTIQPWKVCLGSINQANSKVRASTESCWLHWTNKLTLKQGLNPCGQVKCLEMRKQEHTKTAFTQSAQESQLEYKGFKHHTWRSMQANFGIIKNKKNN